MLISYVQVAFANANVSVLSNNIVGVNHSAQPTAVNGFNLAITPDENVSDKPKSLIPFLSYKENMTFSQKKLPTQILEIIDPNAPHSGMTRDEIRASLILDENLIPAEDVFTKLGISQPTGDLIKVTIHQNASISTHTVDSYVVRILYKSDNVLAAWVDLNTIEKIAYLDEVKYIDLIGPPLHQGTYPPVSPSAILPETQPVLTENHSLDIQSTSPLLFQIYPLKRAPRPLLCHSRACL